MATRSHRSIDHRIIHNAIEIGIETGKIRTTVIESLLIGRQRLDEVLNIKTKIGNCNIKNIVGDLIIDTQMDLIIIIVIGKECGTERKSPVITIRIDPIKAVQVIGIVTEISIVEIKTEKETAADEEKSC